jgi:hypothetical protein
MTVKNVTWCIVMRGSSMVDVDEPREVTTEGAKTPVYEVPGLGGVFSSKETCLKFLAKVRINEIMSNEGFPEWDDMTLEVTSVEDGDH